MEREDKYSENEQTRSDGEIIRHILMESTAATAVKDKMYRLLYEASMSDDKNIDTDLIDECIQTLDLIENKTSYLPEEQKQALLQSLNEKCRHQQKIQRKRKIIKAVGRIAACFLIASIMSSVVVSAFGYNLMHVIVSWGKETFNLGILGQPGIETGDDMGYRIVDSNVENVLKDVEPKPLLPQWLPDGFIFQDAEKLDRQSNTNILLYYADTTKREIVLDFSIYKSDNLPVKESLFEKDENEVEIYEKNNMKHYIFQNIGQVQAVWNDSRVVYNIHGDVSVEEIKKIINSMYGG